MDNANANTARKPIYLFAKKKLAQDCTSLKLSFPSNTIPSITAQRNTKNVL